MTSDQETKQGLLFQVHYIVLIFVARWRHKFCKIAVKNFKKSKNWRKSLCAPLRIDSWEIVQTWFGMNKFVRTKSHTGSKFSKTSLGCLHTWWIVVVWVFSAASVDATTNRQISDHIFWSFFTSLMKDSVANYGSILLADWMYFTTH